MSIENEKLGVLIVGLGGAVATTAVAGIELLKQNLIGTEGLPLAAVENKSLAEYENLVFGGWDLAGENLARAAEFHQVLGERQFDKISAALEKIEPWQSFGSVEFCRNIEGNNQIAAQNYREIISRIETQIEDFKQRENLANIVLINLASTEKFVDVNDPVYRNLSDFEKSLDENSADISPAMIYAYAAIKNSISYANFTPSVAADIPALVELAEKTRTPIAGKDGKTGQTMIKTALAPAFKARSLRVDGWYSTNILGNRDGLALSHEDSLRSKVATKSSVLDEMLGYAVEDHIVDIRYYRPRGDNKEAWDNIDVTGFLGQPMQLKVNFLCRDSILAAPLVIEIARLLDLAKRRGEAGVQEQLGTFFKMPQTKSGAKPVHELYRQEEILREWLNRKT